MSDQKRTAIVTAGGTKEPLDDVRVLTNRSKGTFGYAIARVLAELGLDVSVVCAPEVPLNAGFSIPDVRHTFFSSVASLQDIMRVRRKADIIFHAAAVSDFTPADPIQGKISSASEELVLRLKRTPKILDTLREHFGKEAFIVGFKLLSGVSWRELVDAALKQNKRARLNLTVANDGKNLKGGMHPVVLVTAEGGAINLVGHRQQVAEQLVAFVKKRERVTWFETVHNEGAAPIPIEELSRFSRLLRFAQNSGMLYDSSGNVSMRMAERIVVTPRGYDKSKVAPKDSCLVRVDLDTVRVLCEGPYKSSIDTGIQEALYQRFPHMRYLLHFHNPWGHFSHKTSFPYPCGVKEEADEIIRVVGDSPSHDISVELLHHGALLGFDEVTLNALEQDWLECKEEYREHLKEIGKEEILTQGRLRPVFCNLTINGVVLELPDGVVVYLCERARNKGLGRVVLSQIIQRQLSIVTIDECHVRDFYKKHGFREIFDEENQRYILNPPQQLVSDELFGRMHEWKV